MRRVSLSSMLAVAMIALSPNAAAAGGPGAPGGPGNAPRTALAGPTVLGGGETVVPVRVSRAAAVDGDRRAELVIEGLAYDAPPGVLYQVLLQAGDGRRAALGLISFYTRSAPGYGAPAGADDRRVFDASEALRQLGGEASALVFAPTSGVSGPGTAVAANPGARVRFASVWLN